MIRRSWVRAPLAPHLTSARTGLQLGGRLYTELADDGLLDRGEFVAFEVVHWVADDVVGVDAAYLVDEESCPLLVTALCLSPVDL